MNGIHDYGSFIVIWRNIIIYCLFSVVTRSWDFLFKAEMVHLSWNKDAKVNYILNLSPHHIHLLVYLACHTFHCVDSAHTHLQAFMCVDRLVVTCANTDLIHLHMQRTKRECTQHMENTSEHTLFHSHIYSTWTQRVLLICFIPHFRSPPPVSCPRCLFSHSLDNISFEWSNLWEPSHLSLTGVHNKYTNVKRPQLR